MRLMSEVAQSIISEFVNYPEKLLVEEKTGKASVILGISSSEKDDISQIIGKNGQTITAIKKILERVAYKRGIRCTVYVLY